MRFRRPDALAVPAVLALLTAWSTAAPPVAAQSSPAVDVMLPDGDRWPLPMDSSRGYPAVPAAALAALGWSASEGDVGDGVVLLDGDGTELGLAAESPFVRWEDELVQMVAGPYWAGDSFFVPLQLVIDLLPAFLSPAYAFDEGSRVLSVQSAAGEVVPPPGPPAYAGEGGPRLVVIDPGHGGDDPGAVGPRGVQEKDVAFALGLALARELAERGGVEVRLTREGDVQVPIWSRGESATEWKGDRPGVFISIHANALPDRTGVRGFETYFLSEARTEHERRVAAAENATASEDPNGTSSGVDPFLNDILRDLRAFDHQQWSALLAEEVQLGLSAFHSGPDRGVKQGPLAVLTNALMPSVLVEVGFVTNPEEERLMARPEFQREAAEAIAEAVDRFFERYPPGGAQ